MYVLDSVPPLFRKPSQVLNKDVNPNKEACFFILIFALVLCKLLRQFQLPILFVSLAEELGTFRSPPVAAGWCPNRNAKLDLWAPHLFLRKQKRLCLLVTHVGSLRTYDPSSLHFDKTKSNKAKQNRPPRENNNLTIYTNKTLTQQKWPQKRQAPTLKKRGRRSLHRAPCAPADLSQHGIRWCSVLQDLSGIVWQYIWLAI